MFVTQIESLNDLMQHVTTIVASGKFWWRGVKDAERYKLHPGIFRESDDRNQETNKVRLFQEMSPARYDKCPSDNVDNPEERLKWLFLMQHYRLQTRLLDWTKSPLIATFFAVSNNSDLEKKSDGILWYLSPRDLNKAFFPDTTVAEFFPNSELIQSVYGGAFSGQPGRPSHDPNIAAIFPKQIDLRMLLQLSRFTIHGNPQPLEDYQELNEHLHKIMIPSDKKREIEIELAYLGINESNLFPDLDHLATDLNQNLFEAAKNVAISGDLVQSRSLVCSL